MQDESLTFFSDPTVHGDNDIIPLLLNIRGFVSFISYIIDYKASHHIIKKFVTITYKIFLITNPPIG